MLIRPTAAALLALTTSLALMPGLASAQATPATDKPAESATAAGKDASEMQAAQAAKVGLLDAIAKGEAQGEEKGGRAIDADFERADGKDPAHYSVKVVYPSGKLVEYGVNADTGEVYKTENQPIERYFTRLKPADFQNAKTSLKDAIAIAEQKAGGKAYEAEVEREGDAVAYEIKVAATGKAQEVDVAADGTAKLDD